MFECGQGEASTWKHPRTARNSISLKVLVDKEKERVVFAESDSDFVEILFSFLTMPIGTIIRLTRSQPFMAEIGCMNNIYESVDKLDVQHLWTAACKTMLLCPQNSAETHCKNLKVNINDTEPIRYYTCSSGKETVSYYTSLSMTPRHCLISTYENMRCHCGQLMSRIVQLQQPNAMKVADEDCGRVFLNDPEWFMISDDLHVTPMSTMTSLSLLRKLGIKDWSASEERTVNVELLYLLMSLFSKTPLTDAIFLKQVTVDQTGVNLRIKNQLDDETDADSNVKMFKVKLMVSKSSNMVLYAEAGVDFVDLLLSFLTFPLGSIVELFGGNSPMQSLNTLYKSVEELSVDNYIKSDKCKNMLLHPKLPSYFSCENQLLPIEEVNLYYSTFDCSLCYPTMKISTSENDAPRQCQHHNYTNRLTLKVANPKLLTGNSELGGGFLRRPKIFMVTDDLVVTPFSPISAISLLDSLNVPISDVEERLVTVSKKEALTLLKVSLASKSALTNTFIFNFKLKEPKQEK
ncbi:hypothetical protein HHK36_016723 [Tetracentron sinense]|uniref:DUF674 family protein n=1 Tax=Tetracentron sinense TaxID=13715 RepID=A0A834Z1U4_TETSI|nr:hypothetical protein HHK36_016723 [Tetracentron sinense]